jgi:hypothetical protein
MSSQRRIQSSRANGAKSHGPVTPEGKQKSSRNSLQHGILARHVVLDDEDAQSFDGLVCGLVAEFSPQTPAQLALVETMAVARWRLGRIWCIERETLQSEIEKHDPDPITYPARAALGFRDLANNSATLDLLSRYEFRFDRQFARALNLFMKLATYETPLTKFTQTDPVPEPDTPTEPAGGAKTEPAPLTQEPAPAHPHEVPQPSPAKRPAAARRPRPVACQPYPSRAVRRAKLRSQRLATQPQSAHSLALQFRAAA